VAKGAKKFALGQSWTDALARSQYERQANEYLIQQSILQNEVVFSREGLTLLNVDRIYTFKRRLCILSNRDNGTEESYVSSCVHLLHRTIRDFQGRPFSIVLPPRPKPEYSRKSPIRPVRPRRQPTPPTCRPASAKKGPKTPLSASDVTPITRSEWNMFVGSGIRQINPTVTKWTPSPTVLAAA
jgi:hypothetical protein